MLRLLAFIVVPALFFGLVIFGVALSMGWVETEDRPPSAMTCNEVLAQAFIHTVEAQRNNQPFYVTTDRETICLELALEAE